MPAQTTYKKHVKKVRDFIQLNGGMHTAKRISNMTGVKYEYVTCALRDMRVGGLVNFKKKGSTYLYSKKPAFTHVEDLPKGAELTPMTEEKGAFITHTRNIGKEIVNMLITALAIILVLSPWIVAMMAIVDSLIRLT